LQIFPFSKTDVAMHQLAGKWWLNCRTRRRFTW